MGTGNTAITGTITGTDATESTSKTTGAVKTAGGVGIAKNLHVGGTADITGTVDITGNTAITGTITGTDATESTSKTTGAVKTAGGVGIAKNLHVGGTADITGNTKITGTTQITGNVGVNQAPGTKSLMVNGAVSGVGAYVDASDRRWKKNIVQLSHSLSRVLNITGVHFDWRRQEFPEKNFPPNGRIGFIAQDLEEVVPEVVDTDGEGFKSVAYSSLAPVFVEAIKEQQRTIAEQENRLAAQQRTIEQLLRRVAALETA